VAGEARIAKNQIADARRRKEKLAKEMLSQFMHQFAELAAKFQPISANGKPNRKWDEHKYKDPAAKLDKLDTLLAQTSTRSESAALFPEMLSLLILRLS
jgi:hypothetical protein